MSDRTTHPQCNNPQCKEEPRKCESSLSCKATAELDEEIEKDMEKEDASLKELLDADANDQNSQ